MEQRKVILYVDDDADDREFLSFAIHKVSPGTEVVLAEDGVKALDLLSSTASASKPCLIVLDLNMPLLDGRETFERMRRQPELDLVPTIIFTSSLNPNDKALFQRLGVECISKPENLDYMLDIAAHMVARCCE